MKKYIILLTALLVVSCEQFKEVADVDKVEGLTVTLNLDASGVNVEIPRPESYNVKFMNYNDKFELVTTSSNINNLSVDGLIPGIYSVNITAEVIHNGFSYYYSGNLTNVTITDNGAFDVTISIAKMGAIIIKEIYYCGSKTPSGGSYFRDQYYEIYNNSEEMIYVDGLCFGNLLPLTASLTPPTWDIENQEDYVFFDKVWQVPGNGTDYPLLPGESIIIAQMAANHQIESLNPACPVNLLSAEFETFINTTAIISDNPAHNMNIAWWESYRVPQWLVPVFGGAYAMFFPDENTDFSVWTKQVNSSAVAKEIPLDLIIDAVELVNDATKIQQKRIPSTLDAGATFVSGTYRGESVSRKIRETKEDGRVIYWDTNNTSEDFQVNATPVPRRGGAKIPSWNTWAK